MAGLNKVILIGNLGKDPEIMTFENGVKKASYSLATTESYKNKEGNWIDQTEWHNIVAWRWLAERALIKGEQIYVEGKLKTRLWDDAEGRKHYITEVHADRIIKLGRREQQAQPTQETPPPATTKQYPEAAEETGSTDDLPF